MGFAGAGEVSSAERVGSYLVIALTGVVIALYVFGEGVVRL